MKYQSIDMEYYRYMKARKEGKEDLNLILKGMKYGYYLFVIIIIFSALFNGNLVFAQGNSIDYEFETGYAYNGVLPDPSTLENQRFTTGATGHFPATYSFTNDTLGENPNNWEVYEVGGTVNIINSLDGHKKIVEMNDLDGGDKVKILQNFTSQTIGTMEFWIYSNDASKTIQTILSDETIRGVNLRIENDKIQYWYSSSLHEATGGSISDNVWNQFRIDFDVTLDTYDFFLNGVLLDDNIPFENTVNKIDNVIFNTATANTNYINYIDAIGYSWDFTYDISFIDDIDISFGVYSSGVLSDTYIDDSNYYIIDSEDLDPEHIKFELGFNISIDGLFSCYITSSQVLDYFVLRDDEFNVLVDVSGTNEMSINDYDLNEVSLEIKSYNSIAYSLSVDYVELKYNTSYNYIVGSNLISEVGLLNETETDKFEFTFDNSGVINQNGDDNVNGFSDIENDNWNNDVVNIYDSIDGDIDKAIRITSAQLGNCGIERDFDVGVNTSEVHWQLDLLQLGYPETEIYTKIENAGTDVIAWFKLNGSYFPLGGVSELADLSYYYDSEWVLLKSNIPVKDNYNMTFVLNWTAGFNSGVLGFDGDEFPITFENDQGSIGNFQIYAINDNHIVYQTLDVQIDWIRIIVNGSSISDELMPENVFILSGQDFSLLYQSFIEITFDITVDNNVSILLNDDVEIIPYTHNVTATRIFFGNFYQDKSYSGLFLKIYNSSEYIIENIKVYGVQLVNQQDSNDNPFLEFDYSNVNPNVSYFYVSGNDLYYHFETDDNSNLEYIQATFDILDLSCEGYSIGFSHQKSNTYLQSECKVQFSGSNYLSFLSDINIQSESLILPQDKIITTISFLITDDNEAVIGENDGYFSKITLQYYSDIDIEITTISLIEVLPIIILLTVIPMAIYYGFGKREELIVPSLALISIFCTAIGIIPLFMEVVILFSCLVYYVIKKKRSVV